MSQKSARARKIESAEDLDLDVPGDLLQRVLGISHETLRRLALDERVEKVKRGRFNLLGSVRKYIAHLQDVAGGRGGEDAQAELAAEKMLLTREQRFSQELRNAKLRGEMVDAVEVKREWQAVVGMIRSTFLSLPGRLRAELQLTPAQVDIVDRAVRKLLEDLAVDRVEAAGDPEGIAGAVPAAAAAAVVDVDRANAKAA